MHLGPQGPAGSGGIRLVVFALCSAPGLLPPCGLVYFACAWAVHSAERPSVWHVGGGAFPGKADNATAYRKPAVLTVLNQKFRSRFTVLSRFRVLFGPLFEGWIAT